MNMRIPSSFFQLLMICAISASFFACEGNNTVTPTQDNDLTDEQVASLVTNSLQEPTQGASASVQKTSEAASMAVPEDCGTSTDTSFVRTYQENNLNAQYDINFSWMPVCNENGIPQSLNATYQSSGIYTTNRMNSDDQSNSEFTVDNLLFGTSYLINGTIVRSGSQELTTNLNNRSVESTTTVVLTNLSVHKVNHTIESGEATVSITGTLGNGNAFSRSGSIVFLGNGTAILTLNGNEFTITL